MRYDLAGNLLSLTSPKGEEYRFTYDAEGRTLSYIRPTHRLQEAG
jgi:YD repeat-containing protein